jgi:hypothetical protein
MGANTSTSTYSPATVAAVFARRARAHEEVAAPNALPAGCARRRRRGPHSERSEQAIEANCLRLLGQNARRICELLSQGQLPDVQGRQREPQNDPAVHPRLG